MLNNNHAQMRGVIWGGMSLKALVNCAGTCSQVAIFAMIRLPADNVLLVLTSQQVYVSNVLSNAPHAAVL